MAKLKSELKFQGRIDDLVAYQKEGVKGTIIQKKGGPNKQQIKTGGQFHRTRMNMNEFKGRATMQSLLSFMLRPLNPCAGYNYTGKLNGLFKPIQEMDTVNDWDRRSIHLASAPHYLEGFQLSIRNPFEGICTAPLRYNISDAELRASVEVPLLQGSKNFFPIGNFPFYRFSFVLAIVPDAVYHELRNEYRPAFYHPVPVVVTGEWQQVGAVATATVYDLYCQFTPPNHEYSLLLAGGIMFGMHKNGIITPVKGAGGGKILKIAAPPGHG